MTDKITLEFPSRASAFEYAKDPEALSAVASILTALPHEFHTRELVYRIHDRVRKLRLEEQKNKVMMDLAYLLYKTSSVRAACDTTREEFDNRVENQMHAAIMAVNRAKAVMAEYNVEKKNPPPVMPVPPMAMPVSPPAYDYNRGGLI